MLKSCKQHSIINNLDCWRVELSDGEDNQIFMENLQTTILGGGCFWCLEAVFDRLQGVTAVESGYMGGHVDSPTYRQVCNGDTGHAEVVRITFNPDETN